MTMKDRLDQIEARVRRTICPTFSAGKGETIEGRILEDDFEFLIRLARDAVMTGLFRERQH